MKHTVSIVLPIFNEAKNLRALYEKVNTALQMRPNYCYEIIMVNDGSTDDSWYVIKELVLVDERIKGLNFSRNFGKEIAISAGYDKATGDAVITMDSDLQHPPSTIVQMLDAWQSGIHIVYTRNKKHYETWFKKCAAFAHYKLLSAISSVSIPLYVQDFRLIDHAVLEIVRNSKNRSRYLRGMIAWTGYSYTCIDVEYDKRMSGKSVFSLSKLLKISMNGLTGFSIVPLQIAAFFSAFIMLTGSALFIYRLFNICRGVEHFSLNQLLLITIYIFIGILFLTIWMLGEYLGRIYDQQKGEPLYVISEITSQIQPIIIKEREQNEARIRSIY